MIRFCAIASAGLLSGCILLADKADYADYRKIRLANDTQARSIAMQQYVEHHPSGRFHEEIQRTRSSQDLAAFEANKGTRAGITYYLRAHPDGAFVAQARSRLAAIALIEQRQVNSEREATKTAQARKLRAEELRRTWVGRFVGYWVQTLTGLQAWGEPIATVARDNPQFSRAFAAQPRPRCTQDECLKYYTSHFAVPVPGGNRLERTLSLVLRLRMQAGKLERAELLLPDHGFSRWFELEQRRAVVDADPVSRAEVAHWAVERMVAMISALASDVAVRNDVTQPVIERPAIAATGELIDTSVESPSEPQNRMSDQPDNAGIGVDANKTEAPTVGELVKPQAAPEPELVFAPVGVGKQGQRVEVAPPPVANNAPAPGTQPGGQGADEVLVLPGVAIPKNDTGEAPPPVAATPAVPVPATPAPEAPPTAAAAPTAEPARGFSWKGLRLTVFASPDAAASGYDGVVIERIVAPARGKAGATKPAPRAR